MQGNHPLKAILFDLDGTLLDSLPAYVLAFQQNIREHTGREISSEELRGRIGIPTPRILANYAGPDLIPAMVERNNQLMKAYADRIVFYPGAREALQTLHSAGYRIAAVTSQIAAELENSRAAIQAEELIDVWVNSDMVAHPKPAADPLLLALERLGIPPRAALMVGDTTNDLNAGRAAGTRTAAVTWGFGQLPDLLDCSPDLVLNRPAELAALPEMTRPLFPSLSQMR